MRKFQVDVTANAQHTYRPPTEKQIQFLTEYSQHNEQYIRRMHRVVAAKNIQTIMDHWTAQRSRTFHNNRDYDDGAYFGESHWMGAGLEWGND